MQKAYLSHKIEIKLGDRITFQEKHLLNKRLLIESVVFCSIYYHLELIIISSLPLYTNLRVNFAFIRYLLIFIYLILLYLNDKRYFTYFRNVAEVLIMMNRKNYVEAEITVNATASG